MSDGSKRVETEWAEKKSRTRMPRSLQIFIINGNIDLHCRLLRSTGNPSPSAASRPASGRFAILQS